MDFHPAKKASVSFSAALALFFVSLLSGTSYAQSAGKSSAQSRNHNAPAFSFEGGKRIEAVPSKVTGMREYDANSDAASRNPGTGIVEVKENTHINRLSPHLLSPGDPAAPFNASYVGGDGKIISTVGGGNRSLVAKKKQATTTVQTLGPDGKMQYKEVPFIGEVASTKKAPAVTELKDGEGKVKEYEWAKKAR